MGNQEPVSVDSDTMMLPDAVQDAIDAYNENRYTALTQTYVWSLPNNPAGGGPGGVILDATAARNVARNTTAKASEAYVAIGRDALGNATRARACIAIGSGALGFGNPGFGNLAIGVYALGRVNAVNEYAATIPGSRNIGIGSLAGYFVESGYMNTFLGRDAGQTIVNGCNNVALGYRAGTSGLAPVGLDGTIVNQYPTNSAENTSVGTNAGALLTGSNNTIIGSSAAQQVRNTAHNVIVGQNAANMMGRDVSENNLALTRPNLTGTYTQAGNVITVSVSGHGAVAGNKVSVQFTSGDVNAVTGEPQWLTVAAVTNASTFTIASPASMSAAGNVALLIVETATPANAGAQNTIIGQNAMSAAAYSGGNQTIIGESAGITSTGANNTMLGSRAGYNTTSGQQNTFLGFNAGRALSTGGGLTTQSNCTVVGYNAAPSGDNQVQLGDARTTTYVYGTVQNRSDLRDKADVRDTELGLDFIEALRPVDYRWDMREDYVEYDDNGERVEQERDGSKKRDRFHHGLIAQEVADVIDKIGVDFGGFQDHSKSGGSDVMSIGYDELIAPLIKAVQQLSARVSELEGK